MANVRLTPTAMELKRLIPRCQVCSMDVSGHRFAQIASTVATDQNGRRVGELLEHVRQHQWDQLTAYKDFEGDQNAVIVYSIFGPHSGGMVVLIRDPVELYEPAEVYMLEQLHADEALVVTQLTRPEDWYDL